MKCKRCKTYECELRVGLVIGDYLCQDCWDDVLTDMQRRGVRSKHDHDEYIQTQYPLFLEGYDEE